MEMRKSESVDKQLSYKPAIIELVELSATSLFTIYRIQILSFFGIHMRKFCLVDKLLCCVMMFLMLYFLDQLILDFFNVHEKRKKLKGDKRGCAELKGKQYSLTGGAKKDVAETAAENIASGFITMCSTALNKVSRGIMKMFFGGARNKTAVNPHREVRIHAFGG